MGCEIMKQAVDAIYEKGVFRPLREPGVAEGQLVRLIIETNGEAEAQDVLSLAAEIYWGLSDKDIVEIEAIALDRRDFFGDPRA